MLFNSRLTLTAGQSLRLDRVRRLKVTAVRHLCLYAADPVGVTIGDPLNYCTPKEELGCDWWTMEKGLDDEYKSSLYWEPYCSESSQINLCKPGSTCDSKEESDTPAENCLFNPTCFCLMDSLAGLPSGGGGSGPTCTPQY